MKRFKSLIKNLDLHLLILPLIFALISVLILISTAYADTFVFSRTVKIQIVAFLIGFVVMLSAMIIDYKVTEKLHWFLYGFSILFLLSVLIPGLGIEKYGARAWLNFGVIYLQPVEIVKLTFILSFSGFLAANKEMLKTLRGIILAFTYLLPLIFIIIVIQNDLGNSLVIIFIAFVMIYFAGADVKSYGIVTGGFILSTPFLYFFLMTDNQKRRIEAFLNPDDMSLPGTYHVWQSEVAIGSGGLFGKGLFQGTQKELEFVPVRESDFIFSVIVEEFGFLGGALIIGLYVFFLYRLLLISKKAKDDYGSLIAIGIMSMFFFQIFENIGMTMGVMPITGITLPFISAGGTSIVANLLALGIALNVCIRSKIINF